MQHVKVGDIYDQSKVIRVDRGLGLLLDIPSTPVSTPAYVTVCSLHALLIVKDQFSSYGFCLLVCNFFVYKDFRYLMLLKRK